MSGLAGLASFEYLLDQRSLAGGVLQVEAECRWADAVDRARVGSDTDGRLVAVSLWSSDLGRSNVKTAKPAGEARVGLRHLAE